MLFKRIQIYSYYYYNYYCYGLYINTISLHRPTNSMHANEITLQVVSLRSAYHIRGITL